MVALWVAPGMGVNSLYRARGQERDRAGSRVAGPVAADIPEDVQAFQASEDCPARLADHVHEFLDPRRDDRTVRIGDEGPEGDMERQDGARFGQQRRQTSGEGDEWRYSVS